MTEQTDSNRIDFKNRKIYGKSGKVYHIEPEKIPVGRFQEYLLQGSLIGFNASFSDLFEGLKQLKALLSDGNNILKAITDGTKIAAQLLSGLAEFAANKPHKVIKFAAIFCNEEGEALDQYDETLIRAKADDWANIPMNDFFLLSRDVIPSLRQNYASIKQSENEENQTQT